MKIWEYEVYKHKTLSDDDILFEHDEDFMRRSNYHDMLDELKKLGRRGWENYAIITEPKQTLYYFKRPLQ